MDFPDVSKTLINHRENGDIQIATRFTDIEKFLNQNKSENVI